MGEWGDAAPRHTCTPCTPCNRYELAIELLPADAAAAGLRKGRDLEPRDRDRELDRYYDDGAAGGDGGVVAFMRRAGVLHRVRSASVGLHSKVVYAGERQHCYLLIGAPLARLAKEAERIRLPMQLKAGIAERLRREKAPFSPSDDADDEGEGEGGGGAAGAGLSREGGYEAYAPYRRRVHELYQLAAHPRFFSCAQARASLPPRPAPTP